jgi:tetratricopeptide (TPR) repeat protein
MNSRIGWRTVDAAAKKNYYLKAKEFAQKAISLKPNDAESNFVMAVAMGRMAEISGAKERVAASKDIKKYVDLALKYNDQHAGAWHVLGKWNYRVANLSFAEEAAAKVLGGKLDAASNARAVECLNNAIRLGKQTMMYHFDLANVYNKMGKTAEAKEQISKASNIYNMNPDNAVVRRDVDALKATTK